MLEDPVYLVLSSDFEQHHATRNKLRLRRNNWCVGLVVPMAVGIIGLGVSNLLQGGCGSAGKKFYACLGGILKRDPRNENRLIVPFGAVSARAGHAEENFSQNRLF